MPAVHITEQGKLLYGTQSTRLYMLAMAEAQLSERRGTAVRFSNGNDGRARLDLAGRPVTPRNLSNSSGDCRSRSKLTDGELDLTMWEARGLA